MNELKNKKITILYVLKILKDGSNAEHPISQAQITRMINMRGFKCDRKTISRDIDSLIKFGYDIRKNRGGGCYFNSPEFTNEDIQDLLEGIHLLENKSVEEKSKLAKKVKSLTNIHDR